MKRFSLENLQSDEVHPHTSSVCPHGVLDKSSVTGLAVSCMEADLEHCRLDIVAPVKFLLRRIPEFLPEHRPFDPAPGKIPVPLCWASVRQSSAKTLLATFMAL